VTAASRDRESDADEQRDEECARQIFKWADPVPRQNGTDKRCGRCDKERSDEEA